MQVTWPAVALLVSMLGAIVAILALVPADDPRGGTIIAVIASAISSLLGGLFAARRAENAVAQSQQPDPEPEPEQPETTSYRPYVPPDDGTGPRYPRQS